MGRKQSGYKELLGWLEKMEKVEGKRPVGLEALGLEAFEGYRY